MKKLNTSSSPPSSHSSVALTLFVDTKEEASSELKMIELESLTVDHLITKLSSLFSLQANRVREVVWKRDPSNLDPAISSTNNKKSSSSSNNNLLVLVDDNVLEHFPDRTTMTVQWEISSVGMVRLTLEF
ncbi:hypothetical protein BJ944DRAFT_273918 [Cunninghamella echinulata]|nr:hypothetical protein BJ944DRAFT_273918 [Cunninghamella echinulata]